jgi:hypothetical protein
MRAALRTWISPVRLGVIAFALALALAGCGSTTIDPAKAEQALIGLAPTGGATVDRAKCPSGVTANAGASFDCTVHLSDGTTGTWTLHIANGQGEVTADGTDFTANVAPTKAGPSEIGATKVVRSPGGVRLRVTLVAFRSNVGAVTDNAQAHVATVQLRIVNTGKSTYRDDALTEITILDDSDTAGDNSDDVVSNPPQPCAKSFYATRLRLAPGASIQGCVPYDVGNAETPIKFALGPGGYGSTDWSLPASS